MGGTNPTSEELVALLSSLCTGASSPFVHRADVLSAAPAVLVGNLRPAHGTDKGDGHGEVWYFLSPKKYKSDDVKPDRRRVRAVAAAGKERWREDAGPKKVEAVLDGKPIVGCFRTFSYGYKTPEKQFKRLGWCMVEYALEDARYDHVLCKVYRSPRAKASASDTNSAVLPSAARLSANQVQESRFTDDAPMMQDQYGAGQSFYQQAGTGPVYGGDTFPMVIGGYEDNLPTYDALTVTAPVQSSYLQAGTGPVYGGDTIPMVIDGYEDNLPTHDALTVSAPVQSFYLQTGTGPVYGGGTFPMAIGGYEDNLPTHDALTVSAPVQHSAGGQVLDGYVVAEGPELGDGLVHGDAIDVEELLPVLDYDPLVSHVAGATPPDDHFFDGLPF